jgi:serine/threonine-protein kinase
MTSESFSLFDIAPGKQVAARYTIVRPRRHSGLSATFEATDGVSGDTVELSVFPAWLFEGPEQKAEYHESLAGWRRVRSPHVLRVREVLDVEGAMLVMVTDRPPGSSLRSWIGEHERMPGERALALVDQLLAGLIEAHGYGLVHGDIKPQTIWVDGAENELEGVLVDGGVTTGLWNAKHLGDRTALIGTPYYAPVEQFGGDSPDVQSDIYNLAAVLYELITGVLPWPGRSMLEVFQAKLDKRVPSMAARAPSVEVDPALEKAIVLGLMADRRERVGSASEFRAALRAAVAG